MIGPIVGATTPLKLQDTMIGGDLAAWGAGQAVDAILNLPPPLDVLEFRAAAMTRVAQARDIGTMVHDEVAALLKGEERPPADPRVAPYLWSWTKFLNERRPIFMEVEQRIVHPRYLYAGTFDFLARIDGRVALGDVKTGSSRVSHRLQLAAYSMGRLSDEIVLDQWHRYHVPETAVLRPLPKIRDYYMLYLKPAGYELQQLDVTAADRRHFLYLAGAYHRLRTWQNGVNHD
jgi:hypothetical protein